MAYTKTLVITDVEDRWLQETLQPYRLDIYPVQEGNTAAIANGLLEKLEGSDPDPGSLK